MTKSSHHRTAVHAGLGLSAISTVLGLGAILVWARTQFVFFGSPPPLPSGDRALATMLAASAPICWVLSVVAASRIAGRTLLWPSFAGPALIVLLPLVALQ